MRKSYFCEAHKNSEQKKAFRYRDSTVYIDLNSIKPRVGQIKKENLIIYDSFIDKNDDLLLLVNYSNVKTDYFWVTKKQIQASKVDAYIEQLALLIPSDYLCNSSKLLVLPCIKKSRTVGLFLGVYNCGIIISYKEIFGHETLSQAASFFMEIIDNSTAWPRVFIN